MGKDQEKRKRSQQAEEITTNRRKKQGERTGDIRIMRQNRHRKVGERKKDQEKLTTEFFRSLPVAAFHI